MTDKGKKAGANIVGVGMVLLAAMLIVGYFVEVVL